MPRVPEIIRSYPFSPGRQPIFPPGLPICLPPVMRTIEPNPRPSFQFKQVLYIFPRRPRIPTPTLLKASGQGDVNVNMSTQTVSVFMTFDDILYHIFCESPYKRPTGAATVSVALVVELLVWAARFSVEVSVKRCLVDLVVWSRFRIDSAEATK